MPATPSRSCTPAALLLLLAGCLGPQPEQEVRYYAVELADVPPPSTAPGSAEPAGSLRLRHLSAAGHLREPIAVRTSEVTYVFLDRERWTEPPIGYLAVALERALFESGAFTRGEGSDAAALDLELRAFELQRTPELAAVCSLSARLTSPEGHAQLDRTFETRVSVDDDSPATIARALSAALESSTQALAGALE